MRSRPSQLSFDALRLASAAMIAFGHLWTIHELSGSEPLMVGPVRLGRLGVAALLGISGYFAFAGGRDSHWTWLRKRLGRLYSGYWWTLALVMLVNLRYHHHPVTPGLLVAHVAGYAAFTHNDQLLAQHLWFISLIVCCYLLAAGARIWRPFLVVAAAAIFWWEPHGPTYTACFLCFLLGGAMRWHSSPWIPVLGAGAGVLLVGLRHPDYIYLTVTALSVWAARHGRVESPRWMTNAAQGSYEFYLLHPLAYLALSEIEHVSFVANLFLGTALAIAASVALGWVQRSTTNLAARWMGNSAERPVGESMQASA